MIRSHLHIVLLFKRLGLILILFSISRLLFFTINHSFFSITSIREGLFIFVHGLRFDLSVTTYLFLPFIILHIIPIAVRARMGYQKVLKGWFNLWVFLILFSNLADIMYFQYTFKRATADALDLMFLGGDFIRLLPEFLTEFWYLVFVWMGLIWYSNKRYIGFEYPDYMEAEEGRKSQLFWGFAILILAIVSGRGGLQLKPIGIINAGYNTSPQNIPLVLNTPFAVMTTLGKVEIEEVNYYKPEELSAIYNPVVKYNKPPDGKSMNVVIIILESFSSEYSSVYGDQANTYTPMLDSLSDNGMAFLRCFANGKKSIEGFPAVIAGLPTLMNEPYITSVFAGNSVKSIAGNLKSKGYATSTYHGGSNGTMGFDAFAQVSGYDRYYGRTEYDNEEHFDGYWGISDEEFFQYFKDGLDQEKEPFTSCFISTSSHNPYNIPERYESVFKGGTMPIHQSIEYADYALGKFFREASKSKWFDNTLFVITADHCAQAEDSYYKNRVGMYAVPLLFYHPKGGLKGTSMRVTQQADIMPSALDYIGYSESFVAYGNSVFNEDKAGFAINYLNDLYQLIQGTYVLQFNGEESVGLYNYEMDRKLSGDLMKSQPEVHAVMEKLMKGIIQSYNYRLVKNEMTVE